MVTFIAFAAGLCIGMLAMGVHMLIRFGNRTVAPVQPMRPMQPAQVPTVIAPHPYDMGRDGYAPALPIEEPFYLLWPDKQRQAPEQQWRLIEMEARNV